MCVLVESGVVCVVGGIFVIECYWCWSIGGERLVEFGK